MVIAFLCGNKVGVNVPVTGPPSGPLRAVLGMTFDYANTTASATATASLLLSSEQRAAAASAILSASGISDNGDAPEKKAVQPAEDLRDVNLIFLLDLGSCC